MYLPPRTDGIIVDEAHIGLLVSTVDLEAKV